MMKFWFWPAIAIVAGLAFAGGLIGTQFSIMRAASESVTLGDAFNATLRTRSSIGVVFVTAAPTLLVLAGLAGWFGSRRSRRRLDA